jgi:subtilisin family serine protease
MNLPARRALWLVRVAVLASALVALLVSSATATGTAAPRTYLLLAKGNALPPGLAAQVSAAGGSLTSSIPEVGIAFAVSTSADFRTRAAGIAGLSSVSHDVGTQWVSQEPRVAGPAIQAGNPPASGDDDFYFDLQWGHDAVDAPEAWEAGTRGEGVRVAVIDTGFDTDHPDLAPNVNLALSEDFTGEGLGYQLPGPFSHGTHTAGTVAAADNGFGTIGVAPDAELVLVKGLPDTGCGSDAPILQGVVYAAGDADADVISMSLGAPLEKSGYLEPGCDPGPDDDVWVTAQEVTEVRKAWARVVDFAIAHGATVIASAGNDAEDNDHTNNLIHLPSDTPGVISVSATGPFGWAVDPGTNLDEPAIYTNYGQSAIDFAAPGGNLDIDLANAGTVCTVAAVATAPCYAFDFVFSTGSNLNPALASYYWSAGTSMAAPHVAGVAAIIVGENGGSMKPSHVEAALRASSDDLGKPGNDDFYGAGRVNAANAVGG